MSEPRVDYARFGRQIALPELGPEGHRRLSTTAVRFEPGNELLRATHERAGGLVSPDAAIVVSVPDAASRPVAAWASIEAARRILGQIPQVIPEGLLARLGR
ncbi:MAG: hypothetical protein Q8S73_27105 [Deltaproteobacteria bacterium]|nr:hypothetical protein [Myxococcales bacterium]MDP3217806.1 hypothetical protein [Deltaproteobacteria bacterium]